MSEHRDALGFRLHDGDVVRVCGIRDELFLIKNIRFEDQAVIENLVPGGRHDTSSVACATLERAINNPVGKPAWFDDTHEPWVQTPIRSSVADCGCYLRRGDAATILCQRHLIAVNTAI